MPRPLSLVAAPTIALFGLAAVPAVGSAATITPSAPCYSSLYRPGNTQYQPITGTISGGTPGGRFQIYGVGGKAGSQVGNFDAAGNASYSIGGSYSTAGIYPSAGRAVKLEVTEFQPGGSPITGSVDIKTATIAVDVSTKPSNPRKKRLVRASATIFAGQKVYGFIVRGTKSTKVLKRFEIGTGNVCGYVSRRAVVAPTNYRTGSYTLYVNAGKKLDKAKALGSGFRIRRSAF